MNHPYIIELKWVNTLDPKYLYLIKEYVPGGELFSLLRNSLSFPVDQAKFYVAHIITIFEYLHEKKIIYSFNCDFMYYLFNIFSFNN